MRKKYLYVLLTALILVCLTVLTCLMTACKETEDKPKEIQSVSIVCGDMVIVYDDETTELLKDAYPEAGHNWNEGETTTLPTCISPGVVTYTCNDCATTKKILLDANGEHEWSNYSYDNDNHWRVCKICAEVETHEHNFGDASNYDDVNELLDCECGINKTVGDFLAYKITFECDQGASVLVYETQDYTVSGLKTNVAYSRDKLGKLLKDGEGQVNFLVNIDEGYILDEILVTPGSGYKNIKGKEDTGLDNVFRITKIGEDLTVTISTVKIADLENFASVTDDNGEITFAWEHNKNIKYVTVTVSSQNGSFDHKISDTSLWKFNLTENKYYSFKFTPYMKNDVAGKTVECSRYYSPAIKTVAFPRIDITTQNYVFPTCDYVSHPIGCWGEGTTNKEYVQCILNLYNSNNELIYQSDKNLSNAEAYTGAKIKVRGNTSAYTEKKPYKIKLNKKCDLLSSFLPNRTDKNYEDKEWLLLKGGTTLNQVAGCSVSTTLQMDYTSAYLYVELYINGDYRGLYILCESVKQGNGVGDKQARCAVSDSGYVVEMDAYWWNEDLYFSTPFTKGKPPQYTFKYPDSDDINAESPEYLYIQEYITNFEKALSENDDSYLEYIDEATFVKWLLAHDILGSYDAGGSNIYMTKFDNTDQSVLKMGPLWDFDSITMNGVNNYSMIRRASHFYYPLLVNKSGFLSKYAELFNEVKNQIISDFTKNAEMIDLEAYNALLVQEQLRWKSGTTTFEAQRQKLITWFEQHLAWMNGEINEINA